MSDDIKINPVSPADANWLGAFIENEWGGNPLVIRSKSYYPEKLPGIIAYKGNDRAGFLSYEIRNETCEIIVFEVFNKFNGLGTEMLSNLKIIAKNAGCKQIYLMTTNDNLDALRFYQKRGFTISNIHVDSVKESRAIKPSIPENGDYGIPLRDEIDLILPLQ